jgi:hypothetical protein
MTLETGFAPRHSHDCVSCISVEAGNVPLKWAVSGLSRELTAIDGIAAAFWIVSAGILFVLGWLLRVAAPGRKMDFILPHGGTEITLWIALSVTAGICEETILSRLLATAVHGPD